MTYFLDKNSDIDKFLTHHIEEMMSACNSSGTLLTNEDAIKAARAVSPIPNNIISEIYNLEAEEPPSISTSPSKELTSNPNILRDIESLIEQIEQNQAKQNESMMKNIEGLLGSILKKVNSEPSFHGSVEQLRVKSPIPLPKKSNKDNYELKSFINDHIQDISPEFTRQLQNEMKQNGESKILNDLHDLMQHEVHAQQFEEQFEQMGSKPELNNDNLLLISMEENRTDVETSTEQESSSVSQYSEALDDFFPSDSKNQVKNQHDNENSIEEIEKWLENIMQTADEMTSENLLALNNATLTQVKENSLESIRQKGISSRQSSSFQSVGEFRTISSRQEMYTLSTPDADSHDSFFSEANNNFNDDQDTLNSNGKSIETSGDLNKRTDDEKGALTESFKDALKISDLVPSVSIPEKESIVTHEDFASNDAEIMNINLENNNNVKPAMPAVDNETQFVTEFDTQNDNEINSPILTAKSVEDNNEVKLQESTSINLESDTDVDSVKKSKSSEQESSIKFSVNKGQYTRTVARYYKKILRQRKKAQKNAQLFVLEKMKDNHQVITSDTTNEAETSSSINEQNETLKSLIINNANELNISTENEKNSTGPVSATLEGRSSPIIDTQTSQIDSLDDLTMQNSNLNSSNSDSSTTLANTSFSDSPDGSPNKIISHQTETASSQNLSDLVENTQKLIKQMKEEINSDILTFASGESEEEYSSIEENDSDAWTDDISGEEIFEDSYMSNDEIDERSGTPMVFVDVEDSDSMNNDNNLQNNDSSTSILENTGPITEEKNSVQSITAEESSNISNDLSTINKTNAEQIKGESIVFVSSNDDEVQIQQIIETVRNAELMIELEENEHLQESFIEIPLEIETVESKIETVHDLPIVSSIEIKIESTSESPLIEASLNEVVVNDPSVNVHEAFNAANENKIIDSNSATEVVIESNASSIFESQTNENLENGDTPVKIESISQKSDSSQNMTIVPNNIDSENFESKQAKSKTVNIDRKTKVSPFKEKRLSSTDQKRKTSLENISQKSLSGQTKQIGVVQKKGPVDSIVSNATKIGTRKSSLDSQSNQKPIGDTRKKSLPNVNVRSSVASNVSKIQSQLLTKNSEISQQKTLKPVTPKPVTNKSGTVATFASKLSKLITPSASTSTKHHSLKPTSSNSQPGPSTSRLPVPIDTKIPKKKYHETCFSDDYQTTDDEEERTKISSLRTPVRTLVQVSNENFSSDYNEPESIEVSMQSSLSFFYMAFY